MSALGVFPASGGAGVLYFANVAAAEAYVVAGMDEGTVAFVETVQDYFRYSKTSTLTVDNITVLSTTPAGGRWLRLNIPSENWLGQAAWYFSTAGNDENDGATAGTPLKTPEELARRLGTPALITAAQVDIYVLTDYGATTNLWNFDFRPVNPCLIYWHGTVTVAYTNNTTGFSAVTVLNRATNTRPTVTDAAAPFAAGQLVRTLVGGKCAFVTNVTGTTARTTAWLTNATPQTTLLPTSVNQAANETYELVTMPALPAGIVRYSSAKGVTTAAIGMFFDTLQLGITTSPNTFTIVANDSTIRIKTYNCKLGRYRAIGGTQLHVNPYILSSVIGLQSVDLAYLGGVQSTSSTSVGGSIFEADYDFFLEGGSINFYEYDTSTAFIGAMGVFRTSGDGLTITAPCTATNTIAESGVVALYGSCSGAGSYGVRVLSGGKFLFTTASTPTVAGVTGEVIYGGTSSTWAAISAAGGAQNLTNGALVAPKT